LDLPGLILDPVANHPEYFARKRTEVFIFSLHNSLIRNGGNAIPKQAGPEAKGSNPTTGLTLLWARNPFRGHF